MFDFLRRHRERGGYSSGPRSVAVEDLVPPRDSRRFYGGAGTIHRTGHLHVEVHEGEVVAVWFRCQLVPFEQVEVDGERARSMASSQDLPRLDGLFLDAS